MPMRIPAAELKAYTFDLMRAHGVDKAQARSVANNLIWSELVGRPNFGLNRLPILLKRMKAGVLRCPCEPRFQSIGESLERLDGGDGFGHYVAEVATRRSIELARATGIGVIGVRNSNFFGTGAYFAGMAAEAGMLSLVCSNSYPKVVPHGGIKAVFGTNPFAFGAPRRDGRALLIDMATSALAGSTVREHIASNKSLPPGLAIDDRGRPIVDPGKVADGALLPFAGAKGYALSIMVELLAGVITGAGVGKGVASVYKDFSESGHNGHLVLTLDIARWMPLDTYYSTLEGLISEIKQSNPVCEVLLPGEIRWRNLEDNADRGIALDEKLMTELRGLSRPHGIVFPQHATPDAADPLSDVVLSETAQGSDREKLRATSA